MLCWCEQEVLRRQAITLKSDVFSFGILLWELTTWLPPTFDQRLLVLDIEQKQNSSANAGSLLRRSNSAGPAAQAAAAAANGTSTWNGPDRGGAPPPVTVVTVGQAPNTDANASLRTPFLLAGANTPGSIDSDYKDGGLTQFHTPPNNGSGAASALLGGGGGGGVGPAGVQLQFQSLPPPPPPASEMEVEDTSASAAGPRRSRGPSALGRDGTSASESAVATSRRLMSQQEREDRANRIHNWTYDQLCIPDSVQSAREMIAEQGRRPPIPASCPLPIKQLIQRCWTDSADQRPTFAQISIELEQLEQSLDKIIRHKFPFR